nr:hypothetical protein [Kibdelosporangium sp. MJ126-NF4]CEL14334.1 hypothetical protein [Kibdelosporangium sp. MJ126-NF4]CTQ88701.1 hypothetical protein [Kibdelosporangium sp. MJ126-NF4]
MIPRWKTAVAVLAVPLGLTACSGKPSPGPSPDSSSNPPSASGTAGSADGLLDALGKAKATPETRAYVEYGRPSATKDWKSLGGTGYTNLYNYAELTTSRLKFDPRKFTTALSVGQPPNTATILWGEYDTGALNQAFAEAQGKRADVNGAAVWTLGEDNGYQTQGPLADAVPPVGFNKVRVAVGSFAFAGSAASLAMVTDPGTETLAKDPENAALAGCLQDVVAAIISRVPENPTPTGIGSRADGTEVLCVLPPAGQAEDVRKKIEDKVGTGARLTGQPWKDVLTNVQTEVVTGQSQVVRMTAKAPQPGVLFTALANRDLPVPR